MSDLQALCDAGVRLHARNLLAAADGNLSHRTPEGLIALTPSGRAKSTLTPGDLAWMNLEGRTLEGTPSSEALMHLAVYRACPEARFVVHAHPPTAIAWSLAHPDRPTLDADVLPEGILAAGAIPHVPYARPGTPALGEALTPFLPDHRLLLLARHGGLAWGESLEEAVGGLERLEHLAQILLAARAFGGATPLPAPEVEALRALRQQLGPRLR